MDVQMSFTSRLATNADIPFIARIEEMASTPPFPESMWAKIVGVTSTSLPRFLQAMYAERACRWGAVEDFVILERVGQPVAACAVYRPEPDAVDRRSIRMERLQAVAEALGWTTAQRDAFKAAYDEAWGDANRLLEPVAEVIIESVGGASGSSRFRSGEGADGCRVRPRPGPAGQQHRTVGHQWQ